MSNELMKVDTPSLSLDDIIKISQLASDSEYFGSKEAQAAIKIAGGQELGIPAVASMRGIDFINGKITISSGIMASLIKTHPQTDYRVREHTNTICKIECFENGESVGFSVFTMEDAKTAGLIGPKSPAWGKYPRNMLFARAISNAIRWFFPYLTSGQAYTPEELDGDYDLEPDFIIETPEAEPEYTTQPAPETTNDDELDYSSLELLVESLGDMPPVWKLRNIKEAIEEGKFDHSGPLAVHHIVAVENYLDSEVK